MARTKVQRMAFMLSILFAIAPFFFAVVRRLNVHHDLFVFWMALASGAAALAIRYLTKSPARAAFYSCITLAVSTVAGAAAAFLAGASGAGGVVAVAFVIGICWALSFWFWARSTEVNV